MTILMDKKIGSLLNLCQPTIQ